MKTITITEEIMNSIEASVVDNGQQVDFDEELNIETIEYNNQNFWLNAEGMDDDNNDCFTYDAIWKGEPNGIDEGSWEYSVKVGDIVELV